jgi:hypothetical protein
MHWIRHFDIQTKSLLSSPDDYRLLLCDGHDSHVSSALVGYTIQHRIALALLPPHSSHLLQPLDVSIFGPLKTALAHRQTQLFRSGVRRIEKAEWVEDFSAAREDAINEKNVLSGWRGSGLFPENLHRMLHQLPDDRMPQSLSDISTPSHPTSQANSTPFFISSSPPEPLMLRSKNQAFLGSLASTNIETEYKIHMRRLSGISERLQAEVTILQKELKEVKEIHAKRKERASGKRLILKGKVVVSTEDVHNALEEAEKATAAKKAKKGAGRKRRKVISESEDERSSLGDLDEREDLDDFYDSEVEILDCITVAM